ncbi:MAG: InlB B-repeat-containing protein [Bacillota bacterium]
MILVSDQDFYQDGTVVDIIAAPEVGYNFDYWEGTGFSGNSDENIEIVMDSNYNLKAVFTDDNSNSSDYDRVVEVKSKK